MDTNAEELSRGFMIHHVDEIFNDDATLLYLISVVFLINLG